MLSAAATRTVVRPNRFHAGFVSVGGYGSVVCRKSLTILKTAATTPAIIPTARPPLTQVSTQPSRDIDSDRTTEVAAPTKALLKPAASGHLKSASRSRSFDAAVN